MEATDAPIVKELAANVSKKGKRTNICLVVLLERAFFNGKRNGSASKRCASVQIVPMEQVCYFTSTLRTVPSCIFTMLMPRCRAETLVPDRV